ncbi:MAG: DUF2058 domain-containing protein [Halioglobus sp.]|mgnify:FL=1|jgi:uncharacterized protein YaiL (DUF2058 family)
MASLKDQLLNAGLIDKKKAKQLKQELRKEAKVRKKGQVPLDDNKEQVKRNLVEKAERDRQLNKQQQEVVERKAIQAQISQLIKMNRIKRESGDIAYQFTDGTRIKKIYVTEQLQKDLVNGRLAIAKLGNEFELLPSSAAEKIRQRDPQVIVLLNTYEVTGVDEDDPYAEYQIPDDLMW